MKNRIISSIAVFLLSISLISCGSKNNNINEAINTNAGTESTTTTVESTEQSVEQSTESIAESKSVTTEVEPTKGTESEVIDPNFNGAGHTETLEETEQTYITYEPLDPTLMYVISNTNGERYSTYHDPNVSEGELYESGLVDANQELLIDGKTTYNGVDYYRLAFQPEMMLKHQIIIPADLVVAELQETPADTEKPVVQQPEVQQPTQQQPEVQQPTDPLPPAEPEVPEWTPDTGVSKEDWDKFFGGGATNGGHTWQPDHPDDYYIDENGNIWGSGAEDPSKIGSLTVH